MTPAEQLSDEQLVKAAAVEIMGWRYVHNTCRSGWLDPTSKRLRYPWNPLTDANDRDMVVMRMEEMGWSWRMESVWNEGQYYQVWFEDGKEWDITATADTPGRAVLIAALKAVRAEKGGE